MRLCIRCRSGSAVRMEPCTSRAVLRRYGSGRKSTRLRGSWLLIMPEWLRSVDNPYYMDGRPRPGQYAAHTWGGFSTAEFVGEMLKITTTHVKEDYYRRNGVPSSDQASITQYWIRRGDYLTWVTISYDPIYLYGTYGFGAVSII